MNVYYLDLEPVCQTTPKQTGSINYFVISANRTGPNSQLLYWSAHQKSVTAYLKWIYSVGIHVFMYVGLLLSQCRRQWVNVKSALGQLLFFARWDHVT